MSVCTGKLFYLTESDGWYSTKEQKKQVATKKKKKVIRHWPRKTKAGGANLLPVAESGLCTTLRTVGQRRRGKPADVSSPDRRCFSATFVWRRYLGSPAVLLTSFVAARFRAWSLASNAREFKSNFDPHLKAQKKEKKWRKPLAGTAQEFGSISWRQTPLWRSIFVIRMVRKDRGGATEYMTWGGIISLVALGQRDIRPKGVES